MTGETPVKMLSDKQVLKWSAAIYVMFLVIFAATLANRQRLHFLNGCRVRRCDRV